MHGKYYSANFNRTEHLESVILSLSASWIRRDPDTDHWRDCVNTATKSGSSKGSESDRVSDYRSLKDS